MNDILVTQHGNAICYIRTVDEHMLRYILKHFWNERKEQKHLDDIEVSYNEICRYLRHGGKNLKVDGFKFELYTFDAEIEIED